MAPLRRNAMIRALRHHLYAAARGATVVEMALLVPLLLLLAGGAIEFGRAFHHYIVITNVAREGARTASRLPCYNGNATQLTAYKNAIIGSAMNEAAANGLSLNPTTDIAINPDPVAQGCTVKGGPIKVMVTYTFATWIGSLINQPTLSIGNFATMMWGGNDMAHN